MKIGIVGAGHIANAFMIGAALIDELEVIALYSRTFEKAEEFCKKHNISKPCKSFEELLSSDIDSVYIASQNDTHFEYSIKAMEAGKNVLCEKPAAINQTQMEILHRTAKDNHVHFMEAMRILSMPSYLNCKELISAKHVGDIVSIEGSLGRITTRLYRHTPELFGGALLDLGIYPIYALLDILGEPKEVMASALKFENGVDSSTTGIFSYEKALGTFYCSAVSETRGDLRVLCTKGTITLPGYFTIAEKVIISHEDGRLEEIQCKVEGNGMEYELREFIKKVDNSELELKVVKYLDIIREKIGLRFEVDKL